MCPCFIRRVLSGFNKQMGVGAGSWVNTRRLMINWSESFRLVSLTMFYRYACPCCDGDLKSRVPATKKYRWYKFITRHTLLCPYCGAEIEKRFADFDTGLATGLAALLAGGGFVSIWGVGRFFVPLVAIMLGVRMLAGSIFSVYIPVGVSK